MRKITRVCVCLVSILLLMATGLCSGCSSDMYSEEQHIQRIKERAEKRFLGEESEYTGLEVYPIYNEYDEMRFVLIEFEPQGFIYVHIKDQAYPWKGMYTLSNIESERCWWPYRIKEGAQEDIIDENGNIIAQTFNREFLRDENGQVFTYYDSHFKVAGIENERRYFLSTVCAVYAGFNHGYIPAVKRGEKYLDLVNGEMIDYTPGMESIYAVADIGFINKPDFDL